MHKCKVNFTVMMALYLSNVLVFAKIANYSLKRDIFMKTLHNSL